MRFKEHSLSVSIFPPGIDAGVGHKVRILDHAGLESAPLEGKLVEHAVLRGGKINAIRPAMRRITFDLDFIETDYEWRDIAAMFRGTAEYPHTIAVTRNGVTRTIEGYRDAEIVPLGERGMLDPVAAQVSFICPDPYFHDEEITGLFIYLSEALGGLEYPMDSGAPYPFEYEKLVNNGAAAVINDGDVDQGFVVTIKPRATIPEVTITSLELGGMNRGSSMTLGPLPAGSTVDVDTMKKMILVNGQSALDKIISGDFPLVRAGLPGDAEVETLIAVENLNGIASAYFFPLYEGV